MVAIELAKKEARIINTIKLPSNQVPSWLQGHTIQFSYLPVGMVQLYISHNAYECTTRVPAFHIESVH